MLFAFFSVSGWPHNKLLEKTLYLQVIDYDRFSRDDPIGETYIPLNEVDLSQSPVMWKFLGPCKDSRVGRLLMLSVLKWWYFTCKLYKLLVLLWRIIYQLIHNMQNSANLINKRAHVIQFV